MSDNDSTMTSEVKYQTLLEILRAMDGVVVAFSGGVDSSLLLLAAQQALGQRALAVIGRSPTYSASECNDAIRLADSLQVNYIVLDTNELALNEFQRNPPHRCYLCKKILFSTLVALANEKGLHEVLEGSNLDDLQDYRPGLQAVKELGVRSPLMEVGLGKIEIRALAQAKGLPVWNKPSLACLASRIPYGSPITEEKLRSIEHAEEVLRARGIAQVRVRHHGDLARIEVEPESIQRFFDSSFRDDILKALKDLGFRYITLDLEGYRTGAMNEALPQPQTKRL